MNKTLGIVVVILLLIIAGGFLFLRTQDLGEPVGVIDSFEKCAAAGYPILESYPEQCRTPEGLSFTRFIGNELEKMDLITIDTPRPNATISSPLTVGGKARGYWYFEASFPVELQDAAGNVLAQHYAEAQSDWMTEEFVPYKSTLSFPSQPTGSKGTLILRKDNPSGLPEHEDSLIVPIVF